MISAKLYLEIFDFNTNLEISSDKLFKINYKYYIV